MALDGQGAYAYRVVGFEWGWMMSNDWQPGDLALCIHGDDACEPPLRVGSIWTVREVAMGRDEIGRLCTGLLMLEAPVVLMPDRDAPFDGWEARLFVRIAPMEELEYMGRAECVGV